MKVKAGDILTFRGCVWNAGWEFDAPLVIYEPVRRLCDSTSISQVSVADKIEDICIDLCTLLKGVKEDWSASDLKEFKWRGWSAAGFKRRKNACHAEVTVKFRSDGEDELTFDVIAAAALDVSTGRLTPIFEGTPATA